MERLNVVVSWLRRNRVAFYGAGVAALALGVAFDTTRPWSMIVAALAFGTGWGLRLLPSEAPSATPDRAPAGPSVAAVLAGLPDPALLIDRDGTLVGHNPRATVSLPTLKPGAPLSFSLRVPEVIEAVRAVAAGQGPRSVDYLERVPVDRWIDAFVAPVDEVVPVTGDAVQGVQHVLVVLRDRTPERRAEKMRVDFVANASHELRTPLASLLGFIETLQGPAKNDVTARERFLEIMRVQANRMARLIDDLLSLSRIELKAHVRPEGVVDLRSVVRQVVDALAPLAGDRGVEIAVAPLDERVEILADRDEIVRVVENLVENAIKYGESGGRVDVAVTRTATPEGRTEARIAVRDHGPGIAPEHLPRLTERFYRADAAESRDKGGTGLGLALVKHIVARHRGKLAIESEVGKGATFAVVFDALPERSAEPAKIAPAA